MHGHLLRATCLLGVTLAHRFPFFHVLCFYGLVKDASNKRPGSNNLIDRIGFFMIIERIFRGNKL